MTLDIRIARLSGVAVRGILLVEMSDIMTRWIGRSLLGAALFTFAQPSLAQPEKAKGKAGDEASMKAGKGKDMAEEAKGKGKGKAQEAKSKAQEAKGKGKAMAEEAGADGKGVAEETKAKGKGKGKAMAEEAMGRGKDETGEAQGRGKARAEEAKAKGRGKARAEEAKAKGRGKAMAEEAKGGGEAMAEEAKGRGEARAEKARAEGMAGAKRGKAAEQRKHAREELEPLFEGGKLPAAVEQQQRRHARRLAKLERIRGLAEQKGDEKTLARVAELEEKERKRHQAWLAEKTAAKKKERGASEPDQETEVGEGEGE